MRIYLEFCNYVPQRVNLLYVESGKLVAIDTFHDGQFVSTETDHRWDGCDIYVFAPNWQHKLLVSGI